MPVDIVYVGQSDVTFVNDEETAFTNLVSIIQKMNMMQDEQFVSFPLGKKTFKYQNVGGAQGVRISTTPFSADFSGYIHIF